MISWLHLIWICPACTMLGYFLAALCNAARGNDNEN